MERVDLRLKLMQYKEAVDDYDLYYNLLKGQVGDRFFYYREQAKFRMNDFPGAGRYPIRDPLESGRPDLSGGGSVRIYPYGNYDQR